MTTMTADEVAEQLAADRFGKQRIHDQHNRLLAIRDDLLNYATLLTNLAQEVSILSEHVDANA